MEDTYLNPPVSLASLRDVLDFVSAARCKFVFRRLKGANQSTWQDREKLRNAGSMLYLVNYDEDHDQPIWMEVPDVKAFAPLFDPEGNKLGFNNSQID